jgi:hypothetical protein
MRITSFILQKYLLFIYTKIRRYRIILGIIVIFSFYGLLFMASSTTSTVLTVQEYIAKKEEVLSQISNKKIKAVDLYILASLLARWRSNETLPVCLLCQVSTLQTLIKGRNPACPTWDTELFVPNAREDFQVTVKFIGPFHLISAPPLLRVMDIQGGGGGSNNVKS